MCCLAATGLTSAANSTRMKRWQGVFDHHAVPPTRILPRSEISVLVSRTKMQNTVLLKRKHTTKSSIYRFLITVALGVVLDSTVRIQAQESFQTSNKCLLLFLDLHCFLPSSQICGWFLRCNEWYLGCHTRKLKGWQRLVVKNPIEQLFLLMVNLLPG